MSRNEKAVSVFVASPSDVAKEKKLLHEVIGELNRTHSRRTGVRLDLLDWEQKVSPDMGEDPQTIVNSKIPEDYDVFVGIMWTRIGTATKRAGSGTIEEFKRAKERWEQDQNSVRVMMYFKTSSPPNLKDIDPDQYKGVLDFRAEIEKEAIYQDFFAAEDFVNFARSHLVEVFYDPKYSDGSESKEGRSDQPLNGVTEYDDQGLFELEEIFEGEINVFTGVVERMGEATNQIGERLQKRTKQIRSVRGFENAETLSSSEKKRLRTDVKNISVLTANDMSEFSAQMEQELPLFRKHLDKSINVLTKIVEIHQEIHGAKEDDSDIESLKENITELRNSMIYMIENIEELHSSLGFTRFSTALLKASRKTRNVLQEVISITRGGILSLEQVLSIIS